MSGDNARSRRHRRRSSSALPHRYPFLMIDRVIGIRGDECGIGIKNVTVNEPQFQGHFPGNPVFPGVLMIEGMAQTGGVLCILAARANRATNPKAVYFMTIDKAKFRRPVLPGDTIEYHMTRTAHRRNMWWYRGEAKVARPDRGRSRGRRHAHRRMSAGMIDPSARIEAGATIGHDCSIGPYCTVGAHVTLGDGCRLIAHVHLTGHTTIGARTVIHPFASLGTPPQSVKYRGGPTRLVVGADCDIREGVTMSTGTEDDRGVTEVGDHCFFMAGSHVAHDCTVGSNVTFANNVMLGGHVSVGDHALLGGGAAARQFVRIGEGAMVVGLERRSRRRDPMGHGSWPTCQT